MTKPNKRYWLCQITGWGVWGLIILYFNFVVFGERLRELEGQKENLISLIIFLVTGILITHLLRGIIKKTDWLKYSYGKIFILFIIAVSTTGSGLFYGSNFIEYRSGYSYEKYVINKRLEKAKKMKAQFELDSFVYVKKEIIVKGSSFQKKYAEIKKTTGWSQGKKGNWIYQNKTNLLGIFYSLVLIAIWMLIYILYHYVEKNRNNQLDRLKLDLVELLW